MTNYIRAIAEVSIPEGKINEFRKLAAEIIDKVEANEPNTLSYEYFLSNDESKCYVSPYSCRSGESPYSA